VSHNLEKQILLGILKLVEQPTETRAKGRRVLPILIYLAAGSVIFYGFHVFRELPAAQTLAVLVGVAIGAVVAFLIASAFFAERVDIICRLVDGNRVRDRLRELGA
jgi:predicted acylesterase/phospholipase RssA